MEHGCFDKRFIYNESFLTPLLIRWPGANQRGIVTKKYKLTHFYYDIDEWELYDRLNDPMEMNNVYNDPAYAEIVDSLNIQLKALRKKYKDSKELDQKYIEKYESMN